MINYSLHHAINVTDYYVLDVSGRKSECMVAYESM